MESIWEKMRTEERRVKANRLGIKVSDLEEQESLLETLEASRTGGAPLSQSDDKTSLKFISVQDGIAEYTKKAAFKYSQQVVKEEDLDDDAQYFDKDSVLFKANSAYRVESNLNGTKQSDVIEDGGKWHTLPNELVDKILMFLGDVDMMGYLNIASKTTFKPSEKVYEYLCRITYPMQTAKKTLQVENWLTWRNMIIHRPRLRTNGFYTLRTMYSKGYCNDNFWEEKQYKSVEVRSD
jgi:hypothetical protein